MIIDQVFELVKQLSAKNQSGGYLTPDEFDRYALLAQSDKLEFELAKATDTTFKNGSLNTFRVNADTPVVGGIVTLPTDYRYFDAAKFNNFSSGALTISPFEELTSDEWGFRLSSEMDKPTEFYPALTVRDNLIELSPTSITIINLNYIKNPPDPIWAYTVVNNRRVFDSVNSIDFTFKEEDISDLVYRISVMLATQIKDKEFEQSSMVAQQSKGG